VGGPLKLKFANHFIIHQKRPFRGHLGLAGYTQSSGTGELRHLSGKDTFSLLISLKLRVRDMAKSDKLLTKTISK